VAGKENRPLSAPTAGRLSPFIVHKDAIRGFVFDVATGILREVDA